MNAPLAEVFRYNAWANLELLRACRDLTDEQLDARPPGISGSVRRLLLHVIGGQQTFVLRTQGRQHEGELNGSSAWPGFDALLDVATCADDDLIAVAQALDVDRDVGLPWQGTVVHLPVSFVLTHALEHGMEHRTEIKVALAQLGVPTPDLDGWHYSSAMGYGKQT